MRSQKCKNKKLKKKALRSGWWEYARNFGLNPVINIAFALAGNYTPFIPRAHFILFASAGLVPAPVNELIKLQFGELA